MNHAGLCYHFLMIRIACIAVLLLCLGSLAAGPATGAPDKVPVGGNFGEIQRQVETIRGKLFVHQVPVYKISQRQLRAIAERELDKQFPGAKMRSYEEMLAWLDMVPPQTDLKSVYGDYLVDQV